MTKQEKITAKLIDARLHEYEDYLDGIITEMEPSCDLCWTQICCSCPFCAFGAVNYGCDTTARSNLFDGSVSYRTPTKKAARARYNELIKILKHNGWQYD
jgi:hypothetical protein